MEYRHLGNSGLKVSAVAYGNWLTHGSQIDEELSILLVEKALDLGITTFDTADVYALGKAEEVLGNALKGIRRDSVEIFTKVYWPVGPSQNDRGLSRKHILTSIDSSLKRLNTDYVDLYQAHRYDYETPIEEVVSAFDQVVRSGKALYIGVSEWRAEEIEAYLKVASNSNAARIISNQPQYNILWRTIEEKVVKFSQKEGIGQIVWSPLAQGVLTGKYRVGESPPKDSRANDPFGGNFLQSYLKESILQAVDDLKEISQEAGISLAKLSLAWVLNRVGVSSAIVGATKVEQLEENVGAVGITLGDDLLEQIDNAVRKVMVIDPEKTLSPKTRP